MKASVIIPTKNPGRIFEQVICSVLAQQAEFGFEVLIIDSGSTDGTIEYINSLVDERVRVHEILPGEFGHGRTRNLAISLTTGEYVVLLTHDAMPASDRWLSNMVRAAEQDQTIAGVFGRHHAYPSADPFTKAELVAHFNNLAQYPIVHLDDPERYRVDQGYRQLLHFFSDNNALVRRSVWDSINYPDVNFAEDQIWAQRIIESGYRKAYADDAAVYHSHNYRLLERLQRSFDESYAFYRLFGYVLAANPVAVMRSWLALTHRDLKMAREANLFRSDLLAVVRMPFDHLMRLSGHYLGARGDRLPQKLRNFLSWDNKLLTGLRKGKSGKEYK